MKKFGNKCIKLGKHFFTCLKSPCVWKVKLLLAEEKKSEKGSVGALIVKSNQSTSLLEIVFSLVYILDPHLLPAVFSQNSSF